MLEHAGRPIPSVAKDYPPAAFGATGTARVSISNTQFRNNAGYGLLNQSGLPMGFFDDNAITDNDKSALLSTEQVPTLSPSSTFAGNGVDLLELTDVRGLMNSDRSGVGAPGWGTWLGVDVPYFAAEGRWVGGTLILDAGVRILFPTSVGLEVSGSLVSAGTAEAPVELGPEKAGASWPGVTQCSGGSVSLDQTIITGAPPDSQASSCF